MSNEKFTIGILIFGMTAFGTMAHEPTRERLGEKVLAVDYDLNKVKEHMRVDRKVTRGDAADYDF